MSTSSSCDRHAARRSDHDQREVGILRHDARQIDERRCSDRACADAAAARTRRWSRCDTASASASRSVSVDTDVERTRIASRARPSSAALGIDRGVDVVVQDVVVAQRVVAVEAAARGELGRPTDRARCVSRSFRRNSADVLGLLPTIACR